MRIFYSLADYIFRMLDNLKTASLKSRMRCGNAVTIRENALIYCPERVTLASGVYIGPRVTVMAQGGVEIGERTMVGPCVTILSVNHDFQKAMQGSGSVQRKRPVTIGSDCWIAGGAIILPGVKVGDRSVVSAGAVVTSDVPPNSIVAGIPARHIRERYRQKDKGDGSSLPLFDEGWEGEA